jgi:ATP-binding protein involved in chromosome partitioning
MSYTREQILEALGKVRYPEKNNDIVSLNMVGDLKVEGKKISFTLIFPNANSPFEKSLVKACEATIKALAGSDAEVDIKTAGKVKVAPIGASEKPLPNVKNIIAVASGKGGVGKSTVAVNLAIALAKTGAKVAILDADIYGPSIPKMFKVENERPYIEKINGKDMIIPIENYGVKMLSIGFFVNPDDALIWRGSMATNALKQLINDAHWGELDYMVLDLPPGTGDIHLTMVQTIPVTGSIIVSTPQPVAIADVIKGISMFKNETINVPLLGVIENMSWFTPEECPENKYYIFGKEGVRKLSEERNIKLLGEVPIVQSIREGSDNGDPVALNENSIAGKIFKDIASNVIEAIELRNKTMEPTKKVEIDPNASCAT